MNYPSVSVIMPVRNDGRYIERSLKAVLVQDYPKERLEIIIVDGMSSDGTRKILHRIINQEKERTRLIKFLDNPPCIVSTAFNIGLKQAHGDIIVRVDGHCEIARDYVRRCVEALQKMDVDCTGGLVKAKGETKIGRAIALAQSSLFGVGDAIFRTGTRKPRYVDTAAFGAYRRDTFESIGYFDEELIHNEDDEFNFRLIQKGGKIWLDPSIRSIYYVRDNLKDLWRQYFQYGFYKVRVIQKRRAVASLRHLIPGAFLLGLLGSIVIALFTRNAVWALSILGPYVIANILASLWSGRKDWRTLPLLPFVFFTLHAAYGTGFIFGLWRWRKLWNYNKEEEIKRIKRVYDGYEKNRYCKRIWSAENPGYNFIMKTLTKNLRFLLEKYGFGDIRKKKILEIGCGSGQMLAQFLEYGATPENLYGIDVLEERIKDGKNRYPQLNLRCEDAKSLSFKDEAFDIVHQSTVFSSIFDDSICRKIASEMVRVLKKDGIIIWYDVRYPNPFNPNTRKMGKGKIRYYFKDCKIDFYPTTLVPPLCRLIAPFSLGLCSFLERFKFLKSHYFAVIKRGRAITKDKDLC